MTVHPIPHAFLQYDFANVQLNSWTYLPSLYLDWSYDLLWALEYVEV